MTIDATHATHRCQHWQNGAQCKTQATHRFLINGVPATFAGYTCQAHGQAVIEEYKTVASIVGTWTMEELSQEPQP